MHAIMEAIDRDLTRAFRFGKQKCARAYKVPWSPKLMNCKRRIRYWKLWESELRNKVDHEKQRSELMDKIEWDKNEKPHFAKTPSLCQIKGHKRKAIKQYRVVLKYAAEERIKFLEEKAEYWAMGDETKKVKVLKNMLRWESQRAVFRRTKEVKGSPAVGPVKSLSIPKNPEKTRGRVVHHS